MVVINIDKLYKRLENETDLELLWRICSEKELNGWTWDKIALEMNRLTGKEKGESGWRKKYASMKKVIEQNNNPEFELKCDTNDLDKEYVINKELSDIDSEIRRLNIAKIQYQDERNAWNKQNYNTARAVQKLDYLEEQLKSLGKINFEEHSIPIVAGKNEMIVLLSDWHIGQCFKSFMGEYNSDIAKERLSKFLDSVKENVELYKVNKIHVVSIGDMISGNIHNSIQVTNRENVIKQIKLATEYMTSFIYECTKLVNNVQFYNVSGNHSRLSKKEDAIHDERLDDLIGWAVNLSLSHIDNFHYMNHRNIDTGIVEMDICNNFYIAVHGDFDPSNKSGASDLSMVLGFTPTAIFRGHYHTESYNNYNGVKIIQGGSLAGSGDQYTVEKRLYGKPSQTLCICNNKGIKVHVPVELS